MALIFAVDMVSNTRIHTRAVIGDPEDMHRFGYVLDQLLSKVFEVNAIQVTQLGSCCPADENRSWLRQTFKARSNVHSVAI